MTRWEWIHMVLGPEGPSPTARLVLVALMTCYYGVEEGYAWPSVATLASRTGHSSERTVQEALREAESAGWVRSVATPRTTHRYPCLKGVVVRFDTPARIAGVEAAPPQRPPQILLGPPQKTAETPAENAPKVLRKEEKKEEGRKAPPCPLCSSPCLLKRPKDRVNFWGCSRFKRGSADSCPGKLSLAEACALMGWTLEEDEGRKAALSERAKDKASTLPTLRVMRVMPSMPMEAIKAAQDARKRGERVDVAAVLRALGG